VELPDLGAAIELVRAFASARPALALELKTGAMALHYRGDETLAEACLALMQEAHRRSPGTMLLHGKKVIELKPAAADKGRAVRAFMAEAPFAGRQPWYFGDDVTDEAAFEAVHALGGVTVKVGEGDTGAAWRLSGPAALRSWLRVAAGMEATA
jgi:trehalose 6-phosphate phosphatase